MKRFIIHMILGDLLDEMLEWERRQWVASICKEVGFKA